MRMGLAWLANSSLECLFEIYFLAQVIPYISKKERLSIVRQLNMAVKYAINNQLRLRIENLEFKLLRVIGFSDS